MSRALVLLLALGALASPAHAQPLAASSPETIDGPSSSIGTLGGAAVARDGSGGVVYLKGSHVFVSRLTGGVFQPPAQVDLGLGGPSSQPVIAAGNGGVLLVAFINGGTLYVDDGGGPSALLSGASNPAIQMTNFGKAYLAFTVSDGGGYDVRTAYYYLGSWSLEATPLNAVAADDAGSGAGRPAVAAAGDGVGIVAWGEEGHVYSRRVWGTAPSVVYEQADVPTLGGWNEVTADTPVLGTGGDSSYVDLEFRQELTNGSEMQSRVLMRRLVAGSYDPVTQVDGLATPGLEGADEPALAAGEYGTGIATAAHQNSHQLFGTLITGNGAPGTTVRLDSLANTAAPHATAAMAGLNADLVAWEQAPGGAGSPEIRARYSSDGITFGPELVLSSPSLGPTESASGLAAAGDVSGDAAIVWVQGTGSATRIVAAQLYQPPGSFGAVHRTEFSRSKHPLLSWTPARERWGLRYVVSVDGAAVGHTTATQFAVPTSLSDGRHRWQVTAVNGGGQQSAMSPAEVIVDTAAPSVHLRVSRHGGVVRVRVGFADALDPISKVVVHWGDGTVARIKHGRHRASHLYSGRGRFKLTVVVTDRAGNKATAVRMVRIR